LVPIDYVMESPAEAARLEAKTDARFTRRLLRLTRLHSGQHALDAGAGTGAVARVMADIVGPAGCIVALDGSAGRLVEGRRIAGTSHEKLFFLTGDLRGPPLREASFDFVWCRFVFEYLEHPATVFDKLIRLVKPGGKLVIGDLDGNGLFHHPLPEDLQLALTKLEEGGRGRFDPRAGKKLYRLFWEKGLSDIRTHLFPYNVYAGAASDTALDNWRQKLKTLQPIGNKLLGPEIYADFTVRFLDFLAQEGTLSYSVLFLVEGIRT
jgi:ubiquinone/menaquinone biosynthesis C-methylase UbiE